MSAAPASRPSPPLAALGLPALVIADVAIVTGPRLRPYLAPLVRTALPHTRVLSTLEIPPEVTLRAVGTVS